MTVLFDGEDRGFIEAGRLKVALEMDGALTLRKGLGIGR